VGSLDILELVRADEEVEFVDSVRPPSDVALELATRRCRHASHIRLGVTLAPLIIITELCSMLYDRYLSLEHWSSRP